MDKETILWILLNGTPEEKKVLRASIKAELGQRKYVHKIETELDRQIKEIIGDDES